MTESLPGGQAQGGRDSHSRDAFKQVLLERATKFTLAAIPRIADRHKRLLLGGRSVTVDGNTLDTTLQLTLAAEHAAGVGGLVADHSPESGVAVSRAALRSTAAMLKARIRADVTDISIPGPAGSIPARRYVPDGTGSPTTPALLLYFHGGGFVIGDLDTHDSLCRLICRDGGIQVVSVDYRLAPEHKAPAALDDAYAAYRWALDHAAGLGATRIVVGGDSAGGNLATVVAQQARDSELPLPALQLLLYPVTDMSSDTRSKTLFADGYFLSRRDMDWFTGHYLDDAEVTAEDPLVSPLLSEDLSGLPPALVVTAGFDPLRDEGNRYAQAMRDAGVVVDLREERSMIHAFANFFPLGGGSATATSAMISALRAHLSHAES
ncbi:MULTISPECIES: alpha/beta hydrolase [unclassified Mycolicibacterium]|uniref:alpha/beta hydrolase n=1 Tax=unclassified Mycolicibacterium TaxID=2636767 RepID=UPI0012DDDB94|nr:MULTISPECIES: alpha/beta hydrolase [unclassified Mycolicibacterium]MUL80571.1 alpha/beta hydrolase [Mycolicibacterium sp. CBMA 329]MUL86338.1 alpha/beta hydrolase [Mycolicibacterium sp. CBMA 331]MUM03085.1 alpha/beta hydrolase [Mycolicibacterium sp. CBMA 334]MUM36634.1 alpha/beta hydrolase [Mycolicibacterium sp. CBMA 247]MUM42402.1 alpha/beta hydrolase [Mycolicibacterium sp. CBMA 294]